MGAMKIEWSAEARAHLREIFDYYLSAAGIRTADKIMGRIDARIYRILPHSPRVGQREFLLEDQEVEYRRLVEGNYKIIYHIIDDTVRIVDIWDCRREPTTLCERVEEPEIIHNL